MTTPQYNFTVTQLDLEFILKQIRFAEQSTAQGVMDPVTGQLGSPNLAAIIGGVGSSVTSAAILPYGLRTVDGTWNNLLPGQERSGAADNIMPRLVAADLQQAGNVPAGFGPPGTTSYTQSSGLVFDAQPRVASNLIVDQTANNRAAVAAALQLAGYSNTQIVAEATVISNLNEPVQAAHVLLQAAEAAILAAGTGPSAALSAAQLQYTNATTAYTAAFDTLAARLQLDGLTVSENGTIGILNLSPDIGLSPSFNGWMTLFGQFFDHGLDLITKGGSGTVFVPLLPDDPLYVAGSTTNFMVLSRATNQPGADGILGTADDIHEHINTTTPFVDQNQTYTSHPSHQVFLREYVRVADGLDAGTALDVVATGRLLGGAHGEANWAEVKAQARDLLGIRLQDSDVFDVPLLATDRYGEFIRGPNGFVQVVTASGLIEGDPTANGGQGVFLPANTVHTGHAFLNDIAHGAAPNAGLTADADTLVGSLPNPNYNPALPVGPNNSPVMAQAPGTYDNELLDRHFITGDGRGNENIGLTTVHTIFHSEHNRLVEDYKHTVLQSGDRAFINEWLRAPLAANAVLPTTPADVDALVASLNASNAWDGERLFQAGRFVTEMQYQHMVFEEFARAVQPAIDPFIFSNSPDIDPSITAEFANVVYRFGHSMLTETVARMDTDMQSDDIGLIAAFLNPVEFDKLHGMQVSVEEATGAIIRGMSRQTGNEIDEFVTEALRNNLVGLPLDLAVLNMARARETGSPSFNDARAAFFAATGDSQLKPFTSWAGMTPELKNPMSIVNFIAAYGTHASITSEATLAGKRAAAMSLVFGTARDLNGDGDTADAGEAAPADRLAFLNSTGAWTAANSGLNDVDFWIGGLAERKNEFGGMLGATFNYVFETQLEKLQNGDRFYYLSRTQGTNMLNELENNTFSKIVMRNSDLGDAGSSHLSSLLFQTPDYILELNQAKQIGADPQTDNPILQILHPMVIRVAPGANGNDGFLQFTGGEHVVLGGTAGNDTLKGGNGIDTLWGDAGNDRLDGGNEADQVHGGDGDDIITDTGTPVGGADFLHGDEGNDVISSGMGNDIVFGGGGKDFIITGNDFTEVFAGRGDDFILGGSGPDGLMGNEGNDWIEGGEGFDGLSGENSELFFNSPIIGHDVLNGQGNDTDYDGESGDDIMVQGAGIQRNNGMFGFDWGIHKGDTVAANSDLGIPIIAVQQAFTLRDRFDSVEGLSGWNLNDTLTGAALLRGGAAGFGAGPGNPPDESDLKSQNVSLINGFAELLGLTPAQVAAMPFNTSVIDITTGAEVIIGGGGSDTIKGNLGNDYLDGDAWLNVRIRVTHNVNDENTAANEWFTVDSMNDIKARMLTGEINPGQLHIVREILQSATAATDVDTAVYNGNRAEYTVTRNANGTLSVAHSNPAGILDDGTDAIRNFEQLQFADQTLFLGNVAPVITSNGGGASAAITVAENSTAVSTITATDANNADPFTSQVLSFSIAGGADAARFAINATTGVLTFAAAPNFEVPTDVGANNVYDVIVQVSDGLAVDTQGLAVTVTNANDAATGALRIASFADNGISASLTATNTLADADLPAPGLVTTYQWQRLTAPNVWTNIAGATSATLGNQSNTTVRVTATYTDLFGANTVVSGETAIVGTGGANTLAGTAGADFLLGLNGIDTLNGGAGNDVLAGGNGDDAVNGGAGNDTILYTIGEGIDTVNGGADTDTLVITGTATADTLNVVFNGTALTQFQAGAISNIESVTVDLLASTNDTLSYGRTAASVTVNLATGAASGFTSIANIENVTGGSGADSLTGSGAANTLNGGAGGDILTGGGGADTIDTGAANDNIADLIRFSAASEFGDTVNNFDASGTAVQIDRVQFGGDLRTLFDDGTNDGLWTFVSGNGVNNGDTAVNLNGTVEALYLSGASGEGVNSALLTSAAAVAIEFNSEFALTAANGEATLLVINDANINNRAAVWQWIQADGAEISVNELTLIGVINANATVTTGSLGFF